MTSVLTADGIGKSFGRQVVLKTAALWAEAGKVTTLMGRNGSGKTTLMRIAVGVLKADYGVVKFRGASLGRRSLASLAREGLMYVPQGGVGGVAYTIRDHFRALRAAFGPIEEGEAIGLARLDDLMDARVGSLSGGERLRASMGLALARSPEVLVIDEPLMGLSPKDQEDVGELLRTLAARGSALVTSGHDAAALLRISDVVIWSVAGTTHHLGSPADAIAHAQFSHEYLGPGFTPDVRPEEASS